MTVAINITNTLKKKFTALPNQNVCALFFYENRDSISLTEPLNYELYRYISHTV